MCTKPKPADEGSAQVVCRGQMSLPAEVKLDMIQDQFVKVYNNSVTLAQQMRASGAFPLESPLAITLARELTYMIGGLLTLLRERQKLVHTR